LKLGALFSATITQLSAQPEICSISAHPFTTFVGFPSRKAITFSTDRLLLFSTTSGVEEAEGHFEEALEMNARMGAKPYLAHTQHEYARMLLARGNAGNREKAMSLLEEALAISRELGMESLEEKALALSITT